MVRTTYSPPRRRLEEAKQVVLNHAPDMRDDVMSVRSAILILLTEMPLSYPDRLPSTCAVGEIDGVSDRRLVIVGEDIYVVPTYWLTQHHFQNRDGIKLTVVTRVC